MKRSVKVEIVVLAVILGATLLFYAPRIEELLFPSIPVSEGSRGLVIITTDGGDRQQSLYVHQRVPETESDSADPVRIQFFFRGDNIDYANDKTILPIEFTVTLAGFDAVEDEIRCGAERTPEKREIDQLTPGARRAIDVDLRGGYSSALAFGEEVTSPSTPDDNEDRYLVYSGTIWPYDSKATVPDDRYVQESGDSSWIFVEECTVPSRFFWRSGTSSDSRTLLPAQVNWTGRYEFRHQWQMRSRTSVARSGENVLSESYPPAQVYDSRWIAGGEVAPWTSSTTEATGPIAYSDQPVMIFQDRGQADRRGIFLLWAGILLGVALAAVLRLTSLALEAYLDDEDS